MAVGSFNPSNVKAEVFDFGTESWTSVNDYPFSFGTSVYDYDMIFMNQLSSYFVIGGHSSAKIAQFKNGQWSHAGELNSSRSVCFRLFFSIKKYSRDIALNG